MENKGSAGTGKIIKKGTYLFKQGEKNGSLYIIRKGNVKVFKTEGEEVVELDVVGPGGIVGEIASIDRGSRSASSIAKDDCEVVEISMEQFENVQRKMPEWFRKIALILVQRLREVDDKIHNTLDGDVLNYLAAVLNMIRYTEYVENGQDGLSVSLKILEDEMYNLLNISPAEVTACVEKMEKMNIVSVKKGRLFYKRVKSIEEMSDKIFVKDTESVVT